MHHRFPNHRTHRSATPPHPARTRRTKGIGLPTTVWLPPAQAEVKEYPACIGYVSDASLPRWALARLITEYTRPGEATLVIEFTAAATRQPVRPPWQEKHRIEESAGTATRAGLIIAVINSGDDVQGKFGGVPADALTADSSSDVFSSAATQARLALGKYGILAVALQAPQSGADFVDPTGCVIRSARREGFSYLQHLVVVEAPVHGGRISTSSLGPTRYAVRTSRNAAIPVHARVHRDVLIFTRPGKTEALA
jgi:hypothetical protein